MSDCETATLVESIITVMIEQSSMLNLYNFESRLRDSELIARPRKITFGNGSITYSNHFAIFGPLIGEVAL